MLRRAFVLVVLACLALACGTTLPPAIRDEIAKTPRGQATVIFFTDFQCPFCRRTHAALHPTLVAKGDRVRVRLVHVPLGSHPQARPAARASICSEDQGVDLTHRLFESSSLSASACEELAVAAGADRERYRACLASPSTEERLTRDGALYDAAGGDGVPILFVGTTRFDGEQSSSTLARAVDDAIEATR